MATSRLIGSVTDGTNSTAASYFTLAKFTAVATGIVSEIHIYSLADGNVKLAIYDDNIGEPDTLITANNTGQAVLANQWNTLNIGNTNVIKDNVYWIACNSDTTGATCRSTGTGTQRYKSATYTTFTFPNPAASGFSSASYEYCRSGWGILVLSPSTISQPIVYGSLDISVLGFVINPQSITVSLSYGSLVLKYPQVISPSSAIQPVEAGAVWVGILGFIKPQGTIQQLSISSPTILKYVWHVILDSRYAIKTPDVNRSYIVGRDQYGNPVYGMSMDSTELEMVGERLDFQQELAIPTNSQAASMASAILSKMRLTKANGIILIPPNCGQELFDVVQITDSGANQSTVNFRTVGIMFDYNPRQSLYKHRLILGKP
jgi:hypothetical protein